LNTKENHVLEYASPRRNQSVPVLSTAKWGLFWGIMSLLCFFKGQGSINGVQTARTQWDEPQLQTLVCFIALWVCWRAFRKIKRSAIPLRGKTRAVVGATLASFKLMMLAMLY